MDISRWENIKFPIHFTKIVKFPTLKSQIWDVLGSKNPNVGESSKATNRIEVR